MGKFIKIDIEQLQKIISGVFVMMMAYFDSTLIFLYALICGFAFNIFAGMAADDVHLYKWGMLNWSKKKFKDSLAELMLISGTTWFLKGIIDMMQHSEKSIYVVQILIWLALHFYIRNGAKNLSIAYPRSLWIKTIYHLISFQFKKFFPSEVIEAVDKAENEIKEKDEHK